MKKSVYIYSIILTCLFVFFTISECQFTTNEINLIVRSDDGEQKFGMPIIAVDGKTYVSLIDVCNRLGFQIIWNEELGVINVFIDKNSKAITKISQEGTLENGRKYKFFGTAENMFDLQKYIYEHRLKYITKYDTKEILETPQEAAECAQAYFGLGQIPVERVSINVYYDVVTDSWVLIEEDSPGTLRIGGHSILTMQRNDGLIKKYGDGLK